LWLNLKLVGNVAEKQTHHGLRGIASNKPNSVPRNSGA
jgi:hypothetical protein